MCDPRVIGPSQIGPAKLQGGGAGIIFFTRWDVLIPSFLGRNVAECEKANSYLQERLCTT